MGRLGEVLFTPEQIAAKVASIGARITADYQGLDLLVVGILKGAAPFVCDLVRHIQLPIEMDFMACSSYGRDTKTTGEVRITRDISIPCAGKHVLLVEDIVDSGVTLNYITDLFSVRQVASLASCCLLDKPSRRQIAFESQYTGWVVPDDFVVGYGLDVNEQYRNLPAIHQYYPHEESPT